MKRVLVLLILMAVAGSLAAFDFGGYLDNTSGFASAPVGTGGDLRLVQSTTLALWVRSELGAWTVDGQGSYTFTPSTPILFDLNRFTIGTDVPAAEAGAAAFGFSLGRMNHTDATGLVLDHTLDGIVLEVRQAKGSFHFGAGTTALLQKPTNSIVLSTPDVLDLADSDVLFAPPRLVATVRYRAIEAFAGQNLTLGATVQEDLRPEDQLTMVGTEVEDPTAGGRYDTQYASAGLSGPLGPGVFYSTSYTLNSGRKLDYVPNDDSGTGSWYEYRTFLQHMAAADLTWFAPEALFSRVRLFGLYSTADTDSGDAFVPLSPTRFSEVFTLQPGNSAHLGLSYSVRPPAGPGSDVLQTELKSVTYFRSSGSGGVSEPSVDPASEGSYVGTDINLAVTAMPFSDVRLVLKAGAFIPNAEVMSPDNEDVKYQVTLQGVLRF
ncbi:MAG: hypothetical protein ACOC0O_02365 [Spirochaetota bacterium]